MFFVKSKRWPLFLLRLISKHGWTKQANRWWFIALYRFVWPLWSRLSFCTLQTKPETNESNKFYSLLLIRRTWLKSSERLNHVTDNIFSWWWWWWWYEEEIRENIIRKVYQIFFFALFVRVQANARKFFNLNKVFHSHLTILHFRVHNNERNFFIVFGIKDKAFSYIKWWQRLSEGHRIR